MPTPEVLNGHILAKHERCSVVCWHVIELVLTFKEAPSTHYSQI